MSLTQFLKKNLGSTKQQKYKINDIADLTKNIYW